MNSLNGGYAMIKYNSTQEELQIAYRSKKPVLCYDENRRAHWAVIEETATESVDEETQEPITIYEYSYRLIDEASGGATLDDIVDSQGNKRFVEGTMTTLIQTGLTYNYNKWSLSGTHLMMVVACTISAGTTIPGTGKVFSITFPSYISDKIVPLANKTVSQVTVVFYKADGSRLSNNTVWLYKENNEVYCIFYDSTSSYSADQYFRIQFDLLIDNE